MSSTQEFNCIFCKETFDTKEELQVHFRKHGDPKFNQKIKTRPQSESQSSSENRTQNAEMVKCDVCNEEFPTISKAITHKHKFHPDHDAKYFCPWCGKLFTMKHLFNKHLQTSHNDMKENDDTHLHCDVCTVDFYVVSAMMYHNKFFHRQDTDLPSIGQSKKLKALNQEVLTIYYCPFCGEEYDNKVNLHKHMGDDHNDENQSPDEVLCCPLCEAIFYHLDAYELHLTFHSKQDLYSEKKEIFEQIEEFSLETVPPIIEKVESVETEDLESAINAVGLDTLLNMAEDNDDLLPKKSKKHKKHKKSKKAAITLDEFLNMNADVFGEGLDFQGIEEVPTQVVAKRLKQKKMSKPTGALKVIEDTDLEKLKKQGIVVKARPVQNVNVKVGSKITTKSIGLKKSVLKKSNTKSQTPDEVLSKLLNQNNSQIKIVKKDSPNAVNTETSMNTSVTEAVAVKTFECPENAEVTVSDVMKSGPTSSETKRKEDIVEEGKKCNENMVLSSLESSKHDDKPESDKEVQKPCDNENIDHVKKSDIAIRNNEVVSENVDKMNNINAINNLKNVSRLVTIKSLNNTGNTTQENVKDIRNVDIEQNSDDCQKSQHSLDAFKHLSGSLTIKSLTSKTPVTHVKSCNIDKMSIECCETDNDNKALKISSEEDMQGNLQMMDKNSSWKSIESLKSLNNITVKPLILSPKSVEDKFSSDEETEKKYIENISYTSNIHSPAKTAPVKNLELDHAHQPKVITMNKNVFKGNISEQLESQNKNTNLLKRLTNITAKPVANAIKNSQLISNNKVNNVQVISMKNNPQEMKTKEIEIFNIDDSESEEENKTNSISQVNTAKVVTKNTSNVPLDKLKTLSKNITVKTTNQQVIHKNPPNLIKKERILEKSANHSQSSMSDFSDEDEDNVTPTGVTIKEIRNYPKSTIHNTLKFLGKHITVKSRNSSPNTYVKSNNDINFLQDIEDHENDSDNDYTPGKVKVTEIRDEHISEDGIKKDSVKNFQDYDGKMMVQSPVESNSDHDNDVNDDTDGEFSDLESQLQASTIRKPIQNMPSQIIKDTNKDIKSSIKDITENESKSPKTVSGIPVGLNKEVSIKPVKKAADNNTVVNKNVNISKVSRSTHQAIQHNVASNSQHNTVNKEVTVKTFQTQTVIEEITTTVTKTIKTVNQSVKQQLQSTNRTPQTLNSQKIQRITNHPNMKTVHGVAVRNATPPTGTKIRGMPPMRASVGAPVRTCNQLVTVRHSNQLVPVRPGSNIIRLPGPRIPTLNKTMPSTSTNQPKLANKQSKVPTSAVNTATTKRSNEGTVGHFSCFKKPKESLIPVSDIPTFENSPGVEASVHYTSNSSASYSSATKIVKGNAVVTSTKVHSDRRTSSQNLSKLNSLSGITVVKSNQNKHAMQVEDKCEVSASKRNTLEAIEKLQKQGLLVKKPRLGENNYSEPSDDDDQFLSEEFDQ